MKKHPAASSFRIIEGLMDHKSCLTGRIDHILRIIAGQHRHGINSHCSLVPGLQVEPPPVVAEDELVAVGPFACRVGIVADINCGLANR